MRRKTKKLILLVSLGLILFLGYIFLLNLGLKRQERLECLEWKRQEREYPNFYWTEWQIEQCKRAGILPK